MTKLNPALPESSVCKDGDERRKFLKGSAPKATDVNPWCGVNSSREYFIKKRKQALTKINSFRENFRKKEKEMKADLEETRRIWRGLSERFKWWGSLP
ncbi:MAG: hypothetical protein QME83_01720 [Thermodesulfobacteriota bacterium]|nr:hypothetical protein [Thermodesulfobacteriota bacterium]